MMRDIKPLNVSPIIKTARWSFLFLGYMYGVRRQHALELYEEKVSVIRRKKLEERTMNKKLLIEKKMKEDVRNLYNIFGVTDIPPEWKD